MIKRTINRDICPPSSQNILSTHRPPTPLHSPSQQNGLEIICYRNTCSCGACASPGGVPASGCPWRTGSPRRSQPTPDLSPQWWESRATGARSSSSCCCGLSFALADAKREDSEALNCPTKGWPQSSPVPVARPPRSASATANTEWAASSLRKAGSGLRKVAAVWVNWSSPSSRQSCDE